MLNAENDDDKDDNFDWSQNVPLLGTITWLKKRTISTRLPLNGQCPFYFCYCSDASFPHCNIHLYNGHSSQGSEKVS